MDGCYEAFANDLDMNSKDVMMESMKSDNWADMEPTGTTGRSLQTSFEGAGEVGKTHQKTGT